MRQNQRKGEYYLFLALTSVGVAAAFMERQNLAKTAGALHVFTHIDKKWQTWILEMQSSSTCFAEIRQRTANEG